MHHISNSVTLGERLVCLIFYVPSSISYCICQEMVCGKLCAHSMYVLITCLTNFSLSFHHHNAIFMHICWQTIGLNHLTQPMPNNKQESQFVMMRFSAYQCNWCHSNSNAIVYLNVSCGFLYFKPIDRSYAYSALCLTQHWPSKLCLHICGTKIKTHMKNIKFWNIQID